eukprot:scaffold1892_cov94-Isochrysis_galbana.AAC.1
MPPSHALTRSAHCEAQKMRNQVVLRGEKTAGPSLPGNFHQNLVGAQEGDGERRVVPQHLVRGEPSFTSGGVKRRDALVEEHPRQLRRALADSVVGGGAVKGQDGSVALRHLAHRHERVDGRGRLLDRFVLGRQHKRHLACRVDDGRCHRHLLAAAAGVDHRGSHGDGALALVVGLAEDADVLCQPSERVAVGFAVDSASARRLDHD